MRSRRSLLPVFFIFFFFSVILYLFFASPTGKSVNGFFEKMILPVQKSVYHSFEYGAAQKTPEVKLKEENTSLRTQLAKQQELIKENSALRDQFKTSTPSPKELLPAQIIGSRADEIILDKGSAQGVSDGDVLIVKDNIIGRIVKVSTHRSVGELLTKNGITFTAKTAKTAALGIIQGRGEGKVVLLNVVLADTLEVNDLVLTKGDIDQSGKGFPPDLIVGKIVAVNKKASNLFQAAEVEPLVTFGKLETVFILTK